MTASPARPVPGPGIMDIRPYVGGESNLDGAKRVIKLSSNESALGVSPKVVEALKAAAGEFHRYPDGGAVRLRAALGKRWGLDPERIVCGAGSDELLTLLCRAYLGVGDEMLYSQYGFLMYPIATKACGGVPVMAPEVNCTTSVDNLLKAVTERTKLLFLANPNNPTGSYIPAAEVKRLRDALPPHILLVLDAAYCEFVRADDYSEGNELVDAGDNVVVTRTFSKLYGLGGMRLGWAYCPASIADVLNRVRNPFNVSSAALVAGEAALADRDYEALALAHNDRWLPWLTEQIGRLGLEALPSVCNFLLVRFPSIAGQDATAADKFLRQNGIIVRGMAAYALGDCLRITVGSTEENQALIEVLTRFVKGK